MALVLSVCSSLWYAFLHNTMAPTDRTLNTVLLTMLGLELMAMAYGASVQRAWDYTTSIATNTLTLALMLAPVLFVPAPMVIRAGTLTCAVTITALDYGRRLHNLER